VRAATLKVSNFRNLANISVPIGHGTVIVGENQSGKSNLAHALRLVLDPTLSSPQRTLRREDFWDGLSDGSPDRDPLAAGEKIEISVRIEDIEEEPAVLAALGAAISETDPLTAEITYRLTGASTVPTARIE
jgi:putative ATP-dependent endonuclease of OLD family